MRGVSLLIKPASGLCNMRCSYCFYQDTVSQIGTKGIMSEETMQTIIKEAFDAVEEHGWISVMFQGGEPTLAGLSFFQNFVSQMEKYNTKKISVTYALQTNGFEIDDEWCRFFIKHKFLVGVSVDANPMIHDKNRVDANGNGTWERVTGNLKHMIKAGVDVNLLCVVTGRCAKNPERVYRSLKELGCRYLQFIPCLDPVKEERGGRPYSLLAQDYGKFLKAVFDVWYKDLKKQDYVSIRLFEDYVHMAMGMPPTTCASSGSCGSYFVVEADGSLYPCDFYVNEEWYLGKIGEEPLEAFLNAAKAKEFVAESRKHPLECSKCQWEFLCHSGCKRDWTKSEAFGSAHNYYCEAYKTFFAYAGKRIIELAGRE